MLNFNRIMTSIAVEWMLQKHVTVVGGAYGLACDLVRCGLGSLTFVDFDRVDASNPARQDLYPGDTGRLKTEAVAEQCRRINPQIEVECYSADFCSISLDEFDHLFGHTDLFIHAADFVPAQARGNIESLRLGKPAMWIGMYAGGRAGEIVYHVPGVTEACYRCICGQRYAAFNRGMRKISSEGGTILDLHLLDAIAGQIAVGILTRGADNRMGRIIDALGNRNLLQVKIDPDYTLGDKDIFAEYLGNHPANFSFSTIALPMEREHDCPDCSRFRHDVEDAA